MAVRVFLGVDIGTSSSKAVLVDESGTVVRSSVREHTVSRPRLGHVEMSGELWWREFVELAEELIAGGTELVVGIGVSGMGPCVLLTDADGTPLRPAILYGVDSRATEQINRLNEEFGVDEILQRCGSALSTQAVGPKLAWLSEHEPEVMAAARRIFMPASWLAWKLTGHYALDLHSASQCTPLFDSTSLNWYEPWAKLICPDLELPPLHWADESIGVTGNTIAGIPEGTPVILGSIDAWTEAVSVGAQSPGDLMLMYGTTMFLICTVDAPIHSPSMWGTVGVFPNTRNLAGGMATSGAITSWLRELVGSPDYPALLAEAAASGPGAHGLLMLPYFAGERTPVMDPDARGIILGLSLEHERGDLYRAALEATALGVRHNVEVMRAAGARMERVIAVGGGTQGGLWTQIVSDVTGLSQVIPSTTIGASYGAAFLAARLSSDADIESWNPPARVIKPNSQLTERYDRLYALYRELYTSTAPIIHTLVEHDKRRSNEEKP